MPWPIPAGTGPDLRQVRLHRMQHQRARCTWAEILNVLNDADGEDAVISFSVQISKGRDFAFSGMVDGLRINDTLYDFEPFGVEAKPVS